MKVIGPTDWVRSTNTLIDKIGIDQNNNFVIVGIDIAQWSGQVCDKLIALNTKPENLIVYSLTPKVYVVEHLNGVNKRAAELIEHSAHYLLQPQSFGDALKEIFPQTQ